MRSRCGPVDAQGVMGLVRAFETWASQAVWMHVGTLAASPYRQQFEIQCEWCAQGWYRNGMDGVFESC